MDFRELLTCRSPNRVTIAARIGLRMLSVPYRVAVRLKNLAYDLGLKSANPSPLPTISVGNLSVGGTGKSPVVAWIAKWMRERKLRVAILSRGYGQLSEGQNDEALEMELLLPDVPHLQHWDRVASAELAKNELDMQVLLLDDAFQHRRIARDLDIVLVDASEPVSARWVLPGGLLREPMSSLRRAHVVILTRIDQALENEHLRLRSSIERIAPKPLLLEARHRPTRLSIFPNDTYPIESLRGMRVLAFCGIGNPSSFFGSLETLGAQILDRKTWPDHHAYHQEDLAALGQWCQSHVEAEMIVCTMKDWVKIQSNAIAGIPLAALRIELEIRNGLSEFEAILSRLAEKASDTP